MGVAQRKGTGILFPMLLLQAELRALQSVPGALDTPNHSHACSSTPVTRWGCPDPLDQNVLSQPLAVLSVDGTQLSTLRVSHTQGQALPTQSVLSDPWTLVHKGLAVLAQLGTTLGATPAPWLPGDWPRLYGSSTPPTLLAPLPPQC